MKTDAIKQLIASGQYDLGVHIYCNNFCKYCKRIEQCVNYAILKEDLGLATPQRQTFVFSGEVLELKFLTAMESVLSFAEKIGFDLEGVLFPETEDPTATDNQLLATVNQCFAESKVLLPKAIAEYDATKVKMKAKISKAVAKSRAKQKASELYIGIEYIDHLTTILPGKLFALYTRDGNLTHAKMGYAKMVVQSIKQIIISWDILLTQIAKSREQYMELLLDYYWIMASVEASFPGAGKYLRQGLDEKKD